MVGRTVQRLVARGSRPAIGVDGYEVGPVAPDPGAWNEAAASPVDAAPTTDRSRPVTPSNSRHAPGGNAAPGGPELAGSPSDTPVRLEGPAGLVTAGPGDGSVAHRLPPAKPRALAPGANLGRLAELDAGSALRLVGATGKPAGRPEGGVADPSGSTSVPRHGRDHLADRLEAAAAARAAGIATATARPVPTRLAGPEAANAPVLSAASDQRQPAIVVAPRRRSPASSRTSGAQASTSARASTAAVAAPPPPPVVIGSIEVVSPAAPGPPHDPLGSLAVRRSRGRPRWTRRR